MSRKIDDPPDAWKRRGTIRIKRSENLSLEILFGDLKNEDESIPQSSILLRMRTLHSKSPSAAKDRVFMLHSRNYLDVPSIKEARSITKKGRFEKVEVGFQKAVIYVSNQRRRELLITSWTKRCHLLPENSFRMQFKKRSNKFLLTGSISLIKFSNVFKMDAHVICSRFEFNLTSSDERLFFLATNFISDALMPAVIFD
ncbi:hypothetical protein CDAR_397351 [Caerostris darwini]|uniref:Uncharacterized protein n=1 Tax=Caerostris darwini TaxID=1538125 RepID=A0AAV4T196_9ARAC|nr:hypothetical protein CDAR_397351 [Caerostris darwini]